MANSEEDNYVRLSLLLTGISPRAVRTLFDKEFAPAVLSDTIKRESSKIVSLNKRGVINLTQLNKIRAKNPDSNSFDVSLMVCLLTNLTPIRGYDRPVLPSATDLSKSADLARIKHYRNFLAHLSDSRVDNSNFSKAWKDMTEAVGRLGSPEMVQECNTLKTKVLDQSNREIMLEITQAREELQGLKASHETLKRSHDCLQENMIKEVKRHKKCQNKLNRDYDVLKTDNDEKSLKIVKLEQSISDTVPWNIREQINDKLEAWKKDDHMFVETRAAKHLLKAIQDNECVTVTASSGVGKTFTVRHIALKMAAEGFEVIPATSSDEISRYYSPNKNTLFIVDDFCGTYSLIEHELRTWERKQEDIESLLKSKKIKIIVACRLQVSQDLLFETIPLFKSCVCDLMSSNLRLLRSERQELADKYLASKADLVHNYLESYECFPLLCRLFFENPTQNIVHFFKSPFRVYETEIQKLYKGKSHSKYCALALCVMFNNHVEEKWFINDIDESQQKIFEATMEECKLSKGTSRRVIRDEMETLTKTFIRKDRIVFYEDDNNFYRTFHDKLFDFLVYHFGMTMPDCIIKYANFRLISKKFVFQKDNANDDFVVLLPDKYLCIYIDRVLNEWYRGNLNDVMTNVNMRNQMFRNCLLKNISTKDVEFQKTLATCKPNQSDLFRNWLIQTNPLTEFCILRDTNLIKWCCENGGGVNQLNPIGTTPLRFACETSDVGLVKCLLEKNADVNVEGNSSSLPLYLASERGCTEIVQMLLERKAKVFTDTLNLRNLYGKSQLYIACYNGYIDIVKLLLEDAKTRKYFYDFEPFLYTAYTRGHKTIVNLLLQHVDVMKISTEVFPYIPNYRSIFYLTCMDGDVDLVKMLLNTKLAAQYNVNDYMETSPLCIACKNGNQKIVDMLLANERFVKEGKNSRESALYVACIKGNEQIVTQLLQNDVFTKHCTKESVVLCLEKTRINKYFTILEKLLQNKIFIKKPSLTNYGIGL